MKKKKLFQELISSVSVVAHLLKRGEIFLLLVYLKYLDTLFCLLDFTYMKSRACMYNVKSTYRLPTSPWKTFFLSLWVKQDQTSERVHDWRNANTEPNKQWAKLITSNQSWKAVLHTVHTFKVINLNIL